MKKLLLCLCALAFAGCASNPNAVVGSMTSAQAIAIAQPIVAGGLTLVLRNNPSYIPVAQQVGTDLSTANWSDVTSLGIDAAVTAAAKKAGADAATASILSSAFDAGVSGYLVGVGETALNNDPNAVLVLQALGKSISTAATLAQANPK